MCITMQKVNNLIARANNSTVEQKKKLCAGIAKYLILKEMYKQDRINEGFINLFLDFYVRTSHVDRINREELQAIIQGRNENETLQNVLNRIPLDNTTFFSYATKVLHTINNNLPIYDTSIERFTNLRHRDIATYTTLCNAYANWNNNGLNLLVNEYNNIVNDPVCLNFISYGNNDFTPAQAMAITEVKKIDFMIWGFGRL